MMDGYITFNETKARLYEGFRIERRIRALRKELAEIRSNYGDIVKPPKTDGGGRSNLPSDPVGTLATDILEEEERIVRLIFEERMKRKKLREMIDDYIIDEEQREILMRRFIFCNSYESIQEDMFMSERKMFTLLRRGIQQIQRKLNDIESVQ